MLVKETNDAIYFYGHKNPFGYLSNFYPCEFKSICKVNDSKRTIAFNCSEQYFMFKKCQLFDPANTMLMHKIISEINPVKIALQQVLWVRLEMLQQLFYF
jgi:predicted NAD-dependent protein-ADP-ribosyltransferase YbiA (DUF1768 family)